MRSAGSKPRHDKSTALSAFRGLMKAWLTRLVGGLLMSMRHMHIQPATAGFIQNAGRRVFTAAQIAALTICKH
jgi:hypothetical protein